MRPVKGIPGGDCDSCSAWLLENIAKTKGARAKVGVIARDQFAILIDDFIRALLEHALPPREKDMLTKEWAGRILAKFHVTLEAHQWKLKKENAAYRERKAKWGKTRADVLVPKSEISQIVQEELRRAESYQFRLGFYREMSPSEWQVLAQKKGIPKVYWSTVDLGQFSTASSDEWWNWLWAYILKDKKVLLSDRDPSKHKKQIRG